MNIEEIASKHLGKAGDGSVVKPYVTPDTIDPSLLVAVPRHLNRTQYSISDDAPGFLGYDVWNCWEVSFLLSNGFPVSGVLRFRYSALTANIVESKSLKLYLNSYNMERFSTDDQNEAIEQVVARFCADLEPVVGGEVTASFVTNAYVEQIGTEGFDILEDVVDYKSLNFDHFNESPSILQSKAPGHKGEINVTSALLRSNCRVTNQPDWGDVYISMGGVDLPTYESLLQYIVSMRKENHFHEEICECIYKRLTDRFNPDKLEVACLYTRRGGIDINPVRTSYENFNSFSDTSLIFKTLRQ